MGDHMQADDTRIAIDESGDDGVTTGDVGYFIEVEVMSRVLAEGKEGYEDWSAYSSIENVGATASGQDNRLYFQFKLPEDPSEEQKAYITNYMQTVNDLIMAGDAKVMDYISLDSFIDWYLVNELFKNADSLMQSSVYFFKDKGGKLHMGPVWDFDLSSGALTNAGLAIPTGWHTRNDGYCGWFNALYKTDFFTKALKARWKELHAEGILDALFTDMDKLTQQIGDAAEENYALWHPNYVKMLDASWIEVTPTAKNGTWSAQVKALRSFLTARIAWMDRQLGYRG